jgi:hypothetical protein
LVLVISIIFGWRRFCHVQMVLFEFRNNGDNFNVVRFAQNEEVVRLYDEEGRNIS